MSYETYEHESDYDSSKNQMNSFAKTKILRMRAKTVLSSV